MSGVFQRFQIYEWYSLDLFPAISSSIAFHKGIYFIKHRVIVTSNDYYATDTAIS